MIDTIKVNYEKDITKEILKKYSNFISKSSNLIDKKKWRIAEGILLIFCIGLTIFRILNPGHYLMEFL